MNDIIFFYVNVHTNPTVTLHIDCQDINRYKLDYIKYADMVEYRNNGMIILYSLAVGTDYIVPGKSHFSQLSTCLYKVKKYYEGSFSFQKSRIE